jgi:hypothetical protein
VVTQGDSAGIQDTGELKMRGPAGESFNRYPEVTGSAWSSPTTDFNFLFASEFLLK